jgi:8-oxo-dGTP pyrophosphatase MutT (NUDIX family)
MTPAIPKKAATVILLRESQPEGVEVFLLKRHEKSSFMAGNFVYPGGRVDRNDGSTETCNRCKGVSPAEAHRMLGESISPDESIAHWVAGIRELFEEAGVLFACDDAGALFHVENRKQQEKLEHYRNLLQQGELTICQVVQEEKLFLALDQLHYYAHWITPEARSERFDTRFFLACHPEGQEATYDRKETTVGAWLTPRKALEENIQGHVALSPPTLKTLEDLSRFSSIPEVFTSLKDNKIQPIIPILTKAGDQTLIIFPWDPEFEIFERHEIPTPFNHGKPSGSGDNTTRLILREGRWLPYCRR